MELKIPTKEFVEARMKIVLPEPDRVDVDIPKALTDTGNNWRSDLYGNKVIKRPAKGEPWPIPELNDKYEMAPLWRLRPRRYAHIEALLTEIAELPLDIGLPRKFWSVGRRGEKREYHIPQVISETTKPYKCYWLKPDKDDSIILEGKIAGKGSSEPFVYRGRKITPIGNRWKIECVSPEDMKFEWSLLFSDSHPTIDYQLQGTLWTRHQEYNDSWSGGTSRHPDIDAWGDPNTPNWERPLEFTSVYLTGAAVYGTAYIGLKQLGFWGALDTAINFIEGVEWAYDLSTRPAYLDESAALMDPPDMREAEASEADPIVVAVSAIKQRNNPKEFIKSGKPSVQATSREAEQRVSAKERDTAWKQVK
ncbi:MAG: hypothetical protein OXG97_14020 [Candidatus Poribacteria bacterium]|nr:hypothetical protein [Candidatus Poribacteria bacterium]